MGMYTNTGLVNHAKMALALKTKYMWGGILRSITKDYIRQLRERWGNQAGTGYTDARWKELESLAGKGYFGVDCIGLIKSYYWSGNVNGGTGSRYYSGSTDKSATDMYALAKVKGRIADMPDIPGLIVYSKSHPHVGIYIGNGYTIESTLGSRGDGVVKRKLDNFWEYYFQCPFIDYVTSATTTAKVKKCTLAFPTVIRSEPRKSSKRLGRYEAGNTVTVLVGTETTDSVSGLKYIRLSGDREVWIVKTAIK